LLATTDDATKAAMDAVIERYDTGRIDLETFAREVAPFRGNLAPADIIGAHDAFLQGPYPGANELLGDLHAAGVKTACLSNTGQGHWKQVNDPADPNFLPLARFSYRFASHLVGVMKPKDGIYEHVERETKLASA